VAGADPLDRPKIDRLRRESQVRTLPAEWRENVAWRNAAEFYRLPVAAVV
jgi:hypothetical protein